MAPPYNMAAPNIPSRIRPRRAGLPRSASGRSKAIRAKMPPSPRLSARNTKTMYLSEMMSTSDQKISDRMPRILSGVAGKGCLPEKVSRRT